MKLVNEDSIYLNAECENCNEIIKIKKEQVIKTTEGFILRPPVGIKCTCGMTHHNVWNNYLSKVVNKCYYCGSTDIEHGVKFLRHGSDACYDVGPVYIQKGLLGKEERVEPLYVDICKSCGNLKFWILETDRQWKK